MDINKLDKYGYGELHHAADNGDVAEVRRLLAAGADVNCKTNRAETALHLAARRGHVDIVRLLLDHGADIDAQDDIS